jgi:Na+/proline symporter
LSPFDNLIILFFLFGIILFSINQSQKNQTSNNESYFLAGKKMHWIVAMFSIVATETSVITFVGIPALSFVDHNWSVLQIVLGWILGRVIVSHFFISMVL